MLALNTSLAQTMSSREIAELTGKEHRNVMRDIRTMLVELHGEEGVLSFEQTYTNPQNGQTYPCFNLPKRETLILVSGYSVAMRAKIIDRWQELETQALQPTKPTVQTRPKAPSISSTFKSCMAMAKLIGLEGNQAILSADRATRKLVGESPLELLEATLTAPVQQVTLTPTQLGKELDPSISAQKVNELLEVLGFQTKVSGVWAATEKGKPHCEVIDSGKRHGDGSMIKQVKWYASVLELIQAKGDAA